MKKLFTLRRSLCLALVMALCIVALAGCSGATKSGSSSSASGSSAESSSSTASSSASSSAASSSTSTAGSSESVSESTADAISFPLQETVHYTAMSGIVQNYKLSDTISWQKLQEWTNVEIELVGQFTTSECKEKMSVIMAGGDYPDMVMKPSGIDFYDLGEQGIMQELDGLIDQYAPNLKARLDEFQLWKSAQSPDGHIYALPQITYRSAAGGNPLWINQKWIDNLGLETPHSLEDLYEVLKAFKEQDANGNGDPDDEIPFTLSSNLFTPDRLMYYMPDGLYFGANCMLLDTGEFVYYPLTDGFKDNYLAYLTKLYQEQLLDQNAFTQTYEQMTAIGKAGDVFGSFIRSGPQWQCSEEHATDYVCYLPEDENHIPVSQPVGPALGLTDKCENPEILVAWADYFYSEEGAMFAYAGPEGETWKRNDDGTFSYLLGKYGDTAIVVKNSQAIQGGNATPMYFPDQVWNVSKADDPVNWWVSKEKFLGINTKGTKLPALSYTPEETNQKADLGTNIDSYIQNYTAEVITGKKDLEATFADFQATLRDMGAEQLFEIHKAAYERAVSE